MQVVVIVPGPQPTTAATGLLQVLHQAIARQTRRTVQQRKSQRLPSQPLRVSQQRNQRKSVRILRCSRMVVVKQPEVRKVEAAPAILAVAGAVDEAAVAEDGEDDEY
jgi:hypothetical protein